MSRCVATFLSPFFLTADFTEEDNIRIITYQRGWINNIFDFPF